jgi:nitroreductase
MSTAMVTDVFEAMRRRRMHRYFAPTPFDDETPRAFAWAATRVPVGGNEPSRIRARHQGSAACEDRRRGDAGYIGTIPAAIILVLTDEERAEAQMGGRSCTSTCGEAKSGR